MTLSPDIRTQNAPFLIGSLMSNLDGGDLAWAFVKAHWPEIIERFPDNTHVRMLAGITALSTPGACGGHRELLRDARGQAGAKVARSAP